MDTSDSTCLSGIVRCSKEFGQAYPLLCRKFLAARFSRQRSIKKTKNAQINEPENELVAKELFMTLVSIQNDKSPGNDTLIKQFLVTFWDEVKDTF